MNGRLTELRVSRNLTQQQLAEELGITQGSITLLEKGKRGFSTNVLIKVAIFFDVTTDYILGMEDKRDMETIRLRERLAKTEQIIIMQQELIRKIGGLEDVY